jgi:hypothetical protein
LRFLFINILGKVEPEFFENRDWNVNMVNEFHSVSECKLYDIYTCKMHMQLTVVENVCFHIEVELSKMAYLSFTYLQDEYAKFSLIENVHSPIQELSRARYPICIFCSMWVWIEMEEHLEEDDTEERWAGNERSIAAPRSCIEQSEILFGLQPPQYQMALKLRFFLRCCMYTLLTMQGITPPTDKVGKCCCLKRLFDFHSYVVQKGSHVFQLSIGHMYEKMC